VYKLDSMGYDERCSSVRYMATIHIFGIRCWGSPPK